jgi:hypothetical protein
MMIMPTDKDYQETKLIKQGKRNMNPDFLVLADWINSTFNVTVINIFFDTIDKKDNRPRLSIIFEYHKDELKFRNGLKGNYDSKKQKIIADKFRKLVNQETRKISLIDKLLNKKPDLKYNTEDLFVVFTSFEPIAKSEVNSTIPESEVKKLKKELDNPDLWEISRCFSGTTFFLYTDKQVKEYEDSIFIKEWTTKYFDILEPFNEFGYFKRDSFEINLDSKENFDNNYESNWFYYYK